MSARRRSAAAAGALAAQKRGRRFRRGGVRPAAGPDRDRGPGLDELRPVVSLEGSDSLSLDDVVGLLYHAGRSVPHALMMLVPEPWEQLPEMDPARRAFYEFHAGLVEQWDGPAALGFSDGVIAGATLDRNGLRPLRYAITSDGLFIAGSEAGTVAVDQATIDAHAVAVVVVHHSSRVPSKILAVMENGRHPCPACP